MSKNVRHPTESDRVRVVFTDGRIWEGPVDDSRALGPKKVEYSFTVEKVVAALWKKPSDVPFSATFVLPSRRVENVHVLENGLEGFQKGDRVEVQFGAGIDSRVRGEVLSLQNAGRRVVVRTGMGGMVEAPASRVTHV